MSSASELILKKEVMDRKLVPKMTLVWWKRRKFLLLWVIHYFESLPLLIMTEKILNAV